MVRVPIKIMVLGPSGGGKTTALRDLNPKTTGIINCDRKNLPLEGAAQNYKTIENADGSPNLEKSNYVMPSMLSSAIRAFESFESRADINTIVIDTFSHIVMADYIENAVGKEFKDYMKMGKTAYILLDMARDSKKNVIVLIHSEIVFNDMGDRVIQVKVPGKMIHSFEAPSFFTTVLITHMERKDKKNHFYFRTQPEANNDPVKNPVRFKGEEATNVLSFLEPNNIRVIMDKLEEYELSMLAEPKLVAKAS